MNPIFIILGCSPLVIGCLINWLMHLNQDMRLPFFVIGILFLLVWGALAYLLKSNASTKEILISLNLVAGVDLILVGVQQFVFQEFWSNIIGIGTQFFFLPVLNIGYKLTFWSHSIFAAFCAAFLLMVLASMLGCKLRK